MTRIRTWIVGGLLSSVAFVVTAGMTAPAGSAGPCCVAARRPALESAAEHRDHVERAQRAREWHRRLADELLTRGR